MKIIITEDQSNKLISFRRRLKDIMYEASYMIDDADEFYGSVDFCHYFPTLKKYVDDVVYEIINQYEHPIYDIDEECDGNAAASKQLVNEQIKNQHQKPEINL